MMNEKCAACIHCEVCGFIESEVAKNGSCDFYEAGKKQEPCCDAISRKAVLDIIRFEDKWLLDAKGHNADTEIAFSGMKSKVLGLPPVTPQPKTGHWIYSKAVNTGEIIFSECSVCGNGESRCAKRMKYCPNCGTKMVDPEESEVNNG